MDFKEKLQKVWGWVKKVGEFIGFGGLLHIETEALVVVATPRCFGHWAIVIALVLGLCKEAYDIFVKKSKIGLSLHDLFMDLVGITIGVVITLYR